MGCHGGFSLDEAIRREWFSPEQVLEDIGLQAGMTFVDVGSGDGFFSMLAAKVVGDKGRVYAVDSDATAIDRLKRRVAEKGFTNVKAISGEAEETVFCQKCADIVFYSIVLHDFYDPEKVLSNAKKMIKPSGLLVDLDWKKKQMEHGPPFIIRFSEEQATKLIEKARFKVENVKDAGPDHYVIKARPA